MAETSREQLIERHRNGLSLERADLRDLMLNHAGLENAKLSRADLEGANLEGSNLKEANLTSANLREAYLGKANLERAILYKADLEEANLEDANLQFADLSHANLIGASLERANLRGARLSYAQLELANLGKTCLEEAQLDNAGLCECYLGGARLAQANLRHARAAEVSLEEADLTGADLRDCQLSGACLSDAILTGSKLHGIEAAAEQFDQVVADWVDFSAEANGLVKVSGSELAEFCRRSKGMFGLSPDMPDRSKRFFGQGDVLRNAALEFDDDSQIEVESYLENCTIALGRRSKFSVGPNGVLEGCQLVGEGEIVIHGKFYEGKISPGIVGPRLLFVGKTGLLIAEVQQSETLTQFAFEHGCSLSLKIRQAHQT
jgi:uncharacterized protein YjbI with pentapeptide repeats